VKYIDVLGYSCFNEDG